MDIKKIMFYFLQMLLLWSLFYIVTPGRLLSYSKVDESPEFYNLFRSEGAEEVALHATVFMLLFMFFNFLLKMYMK